MDLIKYDEKRLSHKEREFRDWQLDITRRAQQAQDGFDWQEAQKPLVQRPLSDGKKLRS